MQACVFITAVPITKLVARGAGGSGGHVLRETKSRGLCELVCPSRTSERGGEGYCVKEGGEEGCLCVYYSRTYKAALVNAEGASPQETLNLVRRQA